MACCQPQRTIAQVSSQPAVGSADGDAPEQKPVLRFLGTTRVRVRGTSSGLEYLCSPRQPQIRVDPRDILALIRSGLFTRG